MERGEPRLKRRNMMKRNLFCGLLALAMALSLAACGGKEQPGSSGGSQTGQTGQTSQSEPAKPTPPDIAEYVFRSGDTTVSVDQDMAEVLSALGEPKEYFEAESCAFEGMDKTYTYSGFVITTRPDGEKDFVNSIALTDDSVTTPEGLYIGSSAADITAAYGECAGATETFFPYTKGNTALNFVLSGGKVISIEYLPA